MYKRNDHQLIYASEYKDKIQTRKILQNTMINVSKSKEEAENEEID